MGAEKLKKNISQKVQEIEYEYWFDQREFGKIMIIASLSILAISLHALFTINGVVDQAENATERLEKTNILLNADEFQQSINALSETGLTVGGGRSIEAVAGELSYAVNSVEIFNQVSGELNQAQKTYQWTVVIGILGLVTGITAMYL